MFTVGERTVFSKAVHLKESPRIQGLEGFCKVFKPKKQFHFHYYFSTKNSQWQSLRVVTRKEVLAETQLTSKVMTSVSSVVAATLLVWIGGNVWTV